MIPVKKKILLISQEMEPYTGLSEIAELAYRLPLFLNDNKCEIRILMPRFGTINERRHRLHEVVRLSGMNIIVNDDDYPLIIKVASLPNSRIQVYFLDNDEFFKRKSVFEDSEGQPFDDNIDRAVFFCKGAIETVRKFGWAPDIIHCHGWMTSLIPLYIRTAYKNDPIFQSSKIIYSLYDTLQQEFTFDEFGPKATINNLEEEDMLDYQTGELADLHKGAIIYSDAVIRGTETMNESIEAQLVLSEKPVLDYMNAETGLPPIFEFYNSLEVAEEVG
jgi:starch synthase